MPTAAFLLAAAAAGAGFEKEAKSLKSNFVLIAVSAA